MRYLSSPRVLLVLTMLFWSANWIVGRGMRDDFTPMGLNFWRWVVALAVLLPFTWRELWRQRGVVRRDWMVIAALGALSITVFNYLVYVAMQDTTAVNGALIGSLQPVSIFLFAWALAGDRITWRQTVGTVISLAGVMAIISKGDPMVLLDVRFNRGDLWAMMLLPVWGVYSIVIRKRPPELSPMALLTAMTVFGLVMMLPVFVYDQLTAIPMHFSLRSVGVLFYLAIFASVMGLQFYNIGVAALGPNTTGLYLHLIPIFTTFQAWLLLGETLHWFHAPGIVLIVAGIYLATISKPGKPAQAAD